MLNNFWETLVRNKITGCLVMCVSIRRNHHSYAYVSFKCIIYTSRLGGNPETLNIIYLDLKKAFPFVPYNGFDLLSRETKWKQIQRDLHLTEESGRAVISMWKRTKVICRKCHGVHLN